MTSPGPNPALFDHPGFGDHELLDSGDAEKLERFGDVVLRRPDPQAIWPRRTPEVWASADLVFVRESDRGGRWEVSRDAPAHARGPDASWRLRYRDASIEVRPTPFKHVGVFPEQATNWEWTRAMGERLTGAPRLLNLFGYTGVASVLAAQDGFRVTHVDASRTSLAWLRANADASGLAQGALRILCEDALAFARREARRGASYEGILLDPPAYGRGPKGEKWVFESGIAGILATCRELLAERSFLALSCYAIGTSPLAMANLLAGLGEGEISAGELALPEAGDRERKLPCGFCARWSRV